MGHDDGETGEINTGSPVSSGSSGSSAQDHQELQERRNSLRNIHLLFLTVWQGDTHTTDGLKSYSWTIGNGRSKINVVDPWSSQHLFNLYRFGFG